MAEKTIEIISEQQSADLLNFLLSSIGVDDKDVRNNNSFTEFDMRYIAGVRESDFDPEETEVLRRETINFVSNLVFLNLYAYQQQSMNLGIAKQSVKELRAQVKMRLCVRPKPITKEQAIMTMYAYFEHAVMPWNGTNDKKVFSIYQDADMALQHTLLQMGVHIVCELAEIKKSLSKFFY